MVKVIYCLWKSKSIDPCTLLEGGYSGAAAVENHASELWKIVEMEKSMLYIFLQFKNLMMLYTKKDTLNCTL